jgi:hypothetical protein
VDAVSALVGRRRSPPVVGVAMADLVGAVQLLVQRTDARAADDAKRAHDKHLELVTFKPGDALLLRTPRMTKLGTCWKGPFTAVGPEEGSPVLYRIHDPVMDRDLVRHVEHLRKLDMSRSSLEEEMARELPEGFVTVERVAP